MNRKLWFLQALFNLVVVGAAIYAWKDAEDKRYRLEVAEGTIDDLCDDSDRFTSEIATLDGQIKRATQAFLSSKQCMHSRYGNTGDTKEEVTSDETGGSGNVEDDA